MTREETCDHIRQIHKSTICLSVSVSAVNLSPGSLIYLSQSDEHGSEREGHFSSPSQKPHSLAGLVAHYLLISDNDTDSDAASSLSPFFSPPLSVLSFISL